MPALFVGVGELAAPLVVEQPIALESGHVDIDVAVVIVVANCDAHPVHFDVEAASGVTSVKVPSPLPR